MRFLTLRRGAAPIPDKQAAEVRLYADEDAVLHVLEADGTDTEVGTGGGGGSMPDPDELAQVLVSVGTVPAQPTFDDLLSLHPQLLEMGWRANHRYAKSLGTSDGVQFLKPTGSSNVYAAEVTSTKATDASEPDWSVAPNPGDLISDNNVDWYNVGPFASFPPTPTTWQAGHAYTMPSLIWPTTPNGHLYVMFPPGPMTSDVAEPDFDSIGYGEYVSDNDGYWMDAGSAAIAPFSPDWLRHLSLVSPDGLTAALRASAVAGMDGDHAAVEAVAVDDSNLLAWYRLDETLSPIARQYVTSEGLFKWDGFGFQGTELGLYIDFDGGVAFGADNVRIFEGRLGADSAAPLALLGSQVAAPTLADLEAGETAIATDDTTGVTIYRRTGGGVLKSVTLPWD